MQDIAVNPPEKLLNLCEFLLKMLLSFKEKKYSLLGRIKTSVSVQLELLWLDYSLSVFQFVEEKSQRSSRQICSNFKTKGLWTLKEIKQVLFNVDLIKGENLLFSYWRAISSSEIRLQNKIPYFYNLCLSVFLAWLREISHPPLWSSLYSKFTCLLQYTVPSMFNRSHYLMLVTFCYQCSTVHCIDYTVL